jgi:hypothetical protein
MVSEKPPRRSRPGQQPVTIDLKADAEAPASKPAINTPHDGPASLLREDAVAQEKVEGHGTTPSPAAAEIAVTSVDENKVPEAPEPLVIPTSAREELTPETAPTAETPQPDTSVSAAQEHTAFSEPKAEANAAEPTAAPHPQPTRSSPAISSLVACGILGGIIALLLAGSMQYAGYLPSAGTSARGGGSSADIAELRQQIAALQAPSDLTKRIAALEAAKPAAGAPSDQLTRQIASLQGDLNALKSALEAQGQNDADLGRRLKQAETKINQPGREQAVARALAAAALKAATERGGGFSAELQTFASVAADDPAIKNLQPYAERGVPSRAELVRRFPAAANVMIDAAYQSQPGESITDRLLSSAMRVVKIRSVGEAQGDTPNAIVARMEERVKNGDLAAAVSEWNSLPEASKKVSADYKKALDARIDVDSIASGTLTRAMAISATAG